MAGAFIGKNSKRRLLSSIAALRPEYSHMRCHIARSVRAPGICNLPPCTHRCSHLLRRSRPSLHLSPAKMTRGSIAASDSKATVLGEQSYSDQDHGHGLVWSRTAPSSSTFQLRCCRSLGCPLRRAPGPHPAAARGPVGPFGLCRAWEGRAGKCRCLGLDLNRGVTEIESTSQPTLNWFSACPQDLDIPPLCCSSCYCCW